MAIQLLTLAIVACETSSAEVKEIISGCQVKTIGGTVNTKYRDYSGEDILEELSNSGVSVQRAERLEDDGASMLNIEIFVPDEQKSRLDTWIIDNHINGESAGALQDYLWGVEVGDSVDMPAPRQDDSWSHEFSGHVIGFREIFAQVEDGDHNVFDIEAERLNLN
jgi:hypothetical protein